MLEFDQVEAPPPAQAALTVTLELAPEEIELALATDGTSLRRNVMMALITAMVATESGETSDALAQFIPWLEPPEA
jgi:hypothetical protein